MTCGTVSRRILPSVVPVFIIRYERYGREEVVSPILLPHIAVRGLRFILGIPMPSTDAFALRRSGLNEFLFAAVGTEANGMVLCLVSVFARLGHDPWREAGRLAGLPRVEATESLARTIAGMPTSAWPLPAATEIATRLIALLPMRSPKSGDDLETSADGTKAARAISIGLVLVSLAFALAFEAGVFTTSDAPKTRGNDVTSLMESPH